MVTNVRVKKWMYIRSRSCWNGKFIIICSMKDHKQKIYLFIYLLYFIMPWTQGSWTMKVVRTNDRHWMSLRPAADIRRQLVVCTHRANWWYYGKNFKPKFAEKINCHVKYGLSNQREQPGIWGTPPSSPTPMDFTHRGARGGVKVYHEPKHM
jgi:hypothetical protein